MYSVEEQSEGFESIISNSDNPEVIKIAEENNKKTKKTSKK